MTSPSFLPSFSVFHSPPSLVFSPSTAFAFASLMLRNVAGFLTLRRVRRLCQLSAGRSCVSVGDFRPSTLPFWSELEVAHRALGDSSVEPGRVLGLLRAPSRASFSPSAPRAAVPRSAQRPWTHGRRARGPICHGRGRGARDPGSRAGSRRCFPSRSRWGTDSCTCREDDGA